MSNELYFQSKTSTAAGFDKYDAFANFGSNESTSKTIDNQNKSGNNNAFAAFDDDPFQASNTGASTLGDLDPFSSSKPADAFSSDDPFASKNSSNTNKKVPPPRPPPPKSIGKKSKPNDGFDAFFGTDDAFTSQFSDGKVSSNDPFAPKPGSNTAANASSTGFDAFDNAFSTNSSSSIQQASH